MIKLIIVIAIVALFQVVKCQDICNQAVSSGFCRAMMVKYYFEKASGECKQFIYGGCGGNQNRFDTIDECKKTCELSTPKCNQKVEVGPCRAQLQRYFYNKDTKNCEMFLFGGCIPNENNFESYDICAKTCF